jgi:hypothetical protein
MIAPVCRHEKIKKHGKNRNGTQRVRCQQCGATWTIEAPAAKPQPLGVMRLPVNESDLPRARPVREPASISVNRGSDRQADNKNAPKDDPGGNHVRILSGTPSNAPDSPLPTKG